MTHFVGYKFLPSVRDTASTARIRSSMYATNVVWNKAKGVIVLPEPCDGYREHIGPVRLKRDAFYESKSAPELLRVGAG